MDADVFCDNDQRKTRRFLEFITDNTITDINFMAMLDIPYTTKLKILGINQNLSASDIKKKMNQLKDNKMYFKLLKPYILNFDVNRQCALIEEYLPMQKLGLLDYRVVKILGIGSVGATVLFKDLSSSHELAVKFVHEVEGDFQSVTQEADLQQYFAIFELCPIVDRVVKLNGDLVAIIMRPVKSDLFSVMKHIMSDVSRVDNMISDLTDLILDFRDLGATHGDLSINNIMVDIIYHDIRLVAIDTGQSSTRIAATVMDVAQLLRSIHVLQRDEPIFFKFWYDKIYKSLNSMLRMNNITNKDIDGEFYVQNHAEYTPYIGTDIDIQKKLYAYNNNH